ncbi:TIGR02680 family protein [Tomitella biformata]|uniref:TIGR02680 family protein n=1 Tax=Tomitella biformata TaxID=630403 RepID=UPI000466C9D5|nr:TIGR02680 family protein [Tomitella biformata]
MTSTNPVSLASLVAPDATPLPMPQLSRWQPLRAGLVDLFYYDRDEFWFRDGRLLLRGNNGTGKSKVLALMLPFLLDADLSPHRVEPDADPKKRMEWNLLLGGAHQNTERLGYTWLEFGRIDEDGVAQFRTIGAGLKAVAGRGMAPPWYFVTQQRIGEDLSLVDHTGIALTKDRLSDALGERGLRYDRAGAYRRAVDEALFGLGEQRYGALVDLLIQLRQPQLSKRPSEKALSAALTHALPPLDQAVLADVAEAFRSLEEDRQEVSDLKESADATASFLRRYRRYAELVTKRRAYEPQRAQSGFDAVAKDLARAQAKHKAAERDAAAAKSALARLEQEQAGLSERERTLRGSEVMDSARELEHAGEAATATATETARAEQESAAAEQVATRRQAQLDAVTDRLDSARTRLEAVRAQARAAAGTAGLGAQHLHRVDADLSGDVRQAGEQLLGAHSRAIAHVRDLLSAADVAGARLANARRDLDGVDSRTVELADRTAAAREHIATTASDLVAGTRRQLHAARELALPQPEDLLAELELWAVSAAGPNPAGARIAAANAAADEQLVLAGAAISGQTSALRDEDAGLRAEATRLESGETASPAAPHTRSASARAARPGAPLWRVTDFAADLDPAQRAGLEAALEAAGILDAWITPDGGLTSADGHDITLAPMSDTVGIALSTALTPAIDSADPQAAALSDAAVTAVLDAIGLVQPGADSALAHTWVGLDGAFRVGVLTGFWRKESASYIGSGAREAARRARLGEVHRRQDEIATALEALSASSTELRGRRQALAAEIAAIPTDIPLRQAHSALSAIAADQHQLTKSKTVAAAQVAALAEAHLAATTAAAEAAEDTGLPAETNSVEELRDALGVYRGALSDLAAELERRDGALTELAERREESEESAAALLLAGERLGVARLRAITAQERLATLRGSVGAEVQELHHMLEQVGLDLAANRQAATTAAAEHEAALEARGTASGLRVQLADRVEEARERQHAAAESLRRFTASGLLAVSIPGGAHPDPDTPGGWSSEQALDLARHIDAALPETASGEDALTRAERAVSEEHKSLADVLGRQGNSVAISTVDGVLGIEITFRGRPTGVLDLAAALETEHGDRDRLLSERERAILENHLVDEVASTMQELIAGAEGQVARMNAELDSRPTSTGMRLRLHWQPRDDGPAGLAAAQQKLRQLPDLWSEEDRAAVGDFLQQEIADVRLRNATGTWLEHLTEALDYRSWNRFVIKRHQNGQWRSATGPASGGERVLAASVPLFAAASAHYGSAGNPHAPRLVTLDEAFAGVDDNARAKYLGLLAAFDLDVVMTSEREWGCYPEVPGLAIAQLSRTDDVAAVLVTRWEWDGKRKLRAAVPARDSLVAPQEVDPDQSELWG